MPKKKVPKKKLIIRARIVPIEKIPALAKLIKEKPLG
jgi:hypothetical protein